MIGGAAAAKGEDGCAKGDGFLGCWKQRKAPGDGEGVGRGEGSGGELLGLHKKLPTGLSARYFSNRFLCL